MYQANIELLNKIDNQEIVDLQKNNSGITLEEYVKVLNAYQELQEKYNKQKEVIDKVIKLLGNYKHYSTPDEKQNSDNEDLVNNSFDILKEVAK